MTVLSFDPDNTLAGGLYSMTPREAIALACGLCDAVERAVGADGFHGAVWPGNITAVDGQIALGPVCSVGIAEMDPDALEFVAPEQFWGGMQSPAGDVYSIGLILYTALNRGVMPFFEADTEHSAESRAAALRCRMKGKALPYPAAGRELGDVCLKALSFRAEDRYATPGQLKAALCSLSDSAMLPAAAPVIPMSSEQLKNAHSYKVDKDFEPAAQPKKEKKKREKKPEGAVNENMDAEAFRKTKKPAWIIPVLLIVVIVVAAVLLLQSCNKYEQPEFPVVTETPDPGELIRPPVPTATVPPAATPEPTPTPTPAPAEPVYELIMADVTWEEAKALCDQKGGHLATIRNEEQFNEITALAEANGAQFVWLGAYRAANAQWYYVTGDTLDYTVWDEKEPSAIDNDGTREDYLLLWYRPAVGYWSYNDMRNDPIAVASRTYSGKTAYVCQYDR